MKKGTITLYNLLQEATFEIFDFDYNFYHPDLKCVFEKKFINHFYERQIGTETVHSFKRRLKSKLDIMYPYFKQRYEVEMRCLELDFMLNKDLEETFIREVVKDTNEEMHGNNKANSSGSTSSDSTGTTNQDVTGSTKSESMNKDLVPAQNDFGNIENYVSGANKNNDTGSNNETVNSKETNYVSSDNSAQSNLESTSNVTKDENEVEKTKLISKGNIGTTSSAQLKLAWMGSLTNLDEEILAKLETLFLQIYF